jgi:hypothetical protein
MPIEDTRKMPPNSSDCTLPWPEINDSAMNPTDPKIITNGRNFIRMLPGITRGTSGGGSRCISPPGMRGAGSLDERLNWMVLTPAAASRRFRVGPS